MLSLISQIFLLHVIFFSCVIGDGNDFSTIEDVLEEKLEFNAEQCEYIAILKAEIKWLKDVITSNISEIMKNLQKQSEDIELLKEVDTNVEVNVGVLFDLHDNLQSQHESDLMDANAHIVSHIRSIRVEKNKNFCY